MKCNHAKCRICKKCHYPGCTNAKPCKVDKESRNSGRLVRLRKQKMRRFTYDEEFELDRFLNVTSSINIFTGE